MSRISLLVVMWTTFGCAVCPAAESRWAVTGPFQVQNVVEEWQDAQRNRIIPIKAYLPESTQRGPFPVVLFSHGLGGSREAAEYLGVHWASHGFVAVHLQHAGSDRSLLSPARGGMAAMKEAANGRNAADRARDVQFALDRLQNLNQTAGGAWHQLLDLNHVGMCGHSFGAQTTLLVAGQSLGAGIPGFGNFRDARVDCAVALSPPVPRQRMRLREAFRDVVVPIMHMTGTLDDSPLGDTKAADRRLPYDSISTGGQMLITFEGGDHMIFSGRKSLQKRDDEKFHLRIREATTAFWDACLRGDTAAKSWLADPRGLRTALEPVATLEMK